MTENPDVLMVCENFGENLLTPEEGERLRAVAYSALSTAKDLTLDFAGVRIVSSAFLNAAIGRLYADLSAETIKTHLKVRKLSEIGLFTLKRVVDNSKAYYENARFREAADASSDPALEA
jgi:hypothetical protein